MNKTVLCLTILALVSLSVITSCQSQTDITSVTFARNYFESNAKSLSLPFIGAPPTKSESFEQYMQSISPVWKDAIVTEKDGNTLVEVPLSGSVKIVGSIMTIERGKPEESLAATKSYLVVDYSAEPEPQMYVETFLQRGKKCTMLAHSNRSKVIGFQILSDLNGKVFSQMGFQNNRLFAISDEAHFIDINRIKEVNYLGFGIIYKVLSTKGACPLIGYFLCPACLLEYYAEVDDYEDLECPYCGASFIYHGVDYCPDCGELWENCICDDNSCAVCGLNKGNCDNCQTGSSPVCLCEGGLNPPPGK